MRLRIMLVVLCLGGAWGQGVGQPEFPMELRAEVFGLLGAKIAPCPFKLQYDAAMVCGELRTGLDQFPATWDKVVGVLAERGSEITPVTDWVTMEPGGTTVLHRTFSLGGGVLTVLFVPTYRANVFLAYQRSPSLNPARGQEATAGQTAGSGTPSSTSPAITLGSSKGEVKALLGQADEVTGVGGYGFPEYWHYGGDSLTFRNGLVVGWNNSSGKLRVTLGMAQPDAPSVSQGSPLSAIVGSLGTPSVIDHQGTIWKYPALGIGVEIRKDAFQSWVNLSPLVRGKTDTSDGITLPIGATTAEISAVLGDPMGIAPQQDGVIWHFDKLEVGLVNGRLDYWAETSEMYSLPSVGSSYSYSGYSSGSSGSGLVFVHGYFRKDGTYVHSYFRRRPSK